MIFNADFILSLFDDVTIPIDFSEMDADFFFESLPDKVKNIFPSYNFGASKFVLISPNLDFVVKIPFSGTCSEDWGNEDDCFTPFFGAAYGDWDYCKEEVCRYQYAKKLGNFNIFLAKTTYIGTIDNYPIYIQEKCKIFSQNGSNSYHSKEDISKTVETLATQNFDINITWLTDVRLYYGEEKFWSFLNFIKTERWDDLREDNIGYVGSKPVLVDYSGYND